ncbi:dTDP-4-dehydrorhamnose 3,5-epimerase [Flavipsychrobacter stenotrophus]|uniref:dTDP-4-dehydrorhamnose 3,5-epimerase n=1 Tax=Flavipsychrobacter stenotrophus TaxID=2077091 RepID=A0A2S7T1S5_9BACT|nr:dTDP-4-dehydrorhamnose 3,5-epimerase family protein [Flavipsychrobacter stenotrophus]PQJ12797.1 dTDP-4-dehydrorhamnose 3,5-epimerase [Flavipsychrobacter stenotrophus]
MIFDVTPLKDALVVTLPAPTDNRGLFVKTFHDTTLKAAGIDFDLKESYFSISKKDVIRGMHFQTPPYHHSKIVFCPQGAILDVIVDLRKESATYGQFFAHELSQKNHKALYIPEGFAHGFKALSEDAMTYYLVSSEHNKAHDMGIKFDSIGMDWDVENPVISERDLSFIKLNEFKSPF